MNFEKKFWKSGIGSLVSYLQEINKYINNEHNIYNEFNNVEWIIEAGEIGTRVGLVENKSSRKRGEYCCVNNQNQHYPVPYSLKFIVMSHKSEYFLRIFSKQFWWYFFCTFWILLKISGRGNICQWGYEIHRILIETPPTHDPPTWFLLCWKMLIISITVPKIKCVDCV